MPHAEHAPTPRAPLGPHSLPALPYPDDGRHLQVLCTHDAGTPLAVRLRPLLTVGVSEHAYYLDHENRRGEYVRGVVERLLNWDFASLNFEERPA